MINFENKIFKLIFNIVKKKTALHPPFFDNSDIYWVKKCIKSSHVSTRGNFTKKLENEIKNITKSKFAIAMNSGTSALELALRVVGIKNNDEVLVPSMTFVGSVNSITYCNAVPNFIDSDLENFGVDYKKLEKYLSEILIKKFNFFFNKKTGRRVYAIILVHTFGMPGDIKNLLKIAKKYKLKIIEDASEALGSKYNNRSLGTFGDIGVISFNANKIVTSAGGGVMLTQNSIFSKKALHLSSTSKVSHPWQLRHDALGWNTRMPALNASLAFSKLKKFKKILNIKRKIASRYKQAFKNVKGVKFFDEKISTISNFWLNTIILSDDKIKFKNKILQYCNSRGVECRPVWDLISEMEIYKKYPKANLSNAKKLYKKIICLPSGLNIYK